LCAQNCETAAILRRVISSEGIAREAQRGCERTAEGKLKVMRSGARVIARFNALELEVSRNHRMPVKQRASTRNVPAIQASRIDPEFYLKKP